MTERMIEGDIGPAPMVGVIKCTRPHPHTQCTRHSLHTVHLPSVHCRLHSSLRTVVCCSSTGTRTRSRRSSTHTFSHLLTPSTVCSSTQVPVLAVAEALHPGLPGDGLQHHRPPVSRSDTYQIQIHRQTPHLHHTQIHASLVFTLPSQISRRTTSYFTHGSPPSQIRDHVTSGRRLVSAQHPLRHGIRQGHTWCTPTPCTFPSAHC